MKFLVDMPLSPTLARWLAARGHLGGGMAGYARENPEAKIDMPFLIGTIPHVKRLEDAFRVAGKPVVYIAHVLKPDHSDAAFPYWRLDSTHRAAIERIVWRELEEHK